MHDLILAEKIYFALLDICQKNEIKRVKEIGLKISPNSHFNEEILLSFLRCNTKLLFTNDIRIIIEKQETTDTDVVISSIEGE